MWLARQAVLGTREAPGEITVGAVTIGGGTPAVETAGEQREVELVGPGGYAWKPRADQQVLLLRTEDGANLAVGLVGGAAPGDLAPGEVLITSAGGAALRLKNDGSIRLTGTLYINGVKYTPAVGV